jgi:hypothetical protein
MKHLTNIYGDDVDQNILAMEFDLFKTLFKDTTPICFDDIHKQLKDMPREERLLIPNVITICQLLLINPATSAIVPTMASDPAIAIFSSCPNK